MQIDYKFKEDLRAFLYAFDRKEDDIFHGDAGIESLTLELCAWLEDRGKSFSAKVARAGAEERNLDDPHFSGAAYEKPIDQKRLTHHMQAVFAYMDDGEWHTNAEMAQALKIPEGSLSACYRAFRNPRWGAHTVLRERVSGGLFRYKLIPNKESLTYKYFIEDSQTF